MTVVTQVLLLTTRSASVFKGMDDLPLKCLLACSIDLIMSNQDNPGVVVEHGVPHGVGSRMLHVSA